MVICIEYLVRNICIIIHRNTESPQTYVNITPAVGTHRGHYFVKLYILKSTGFFDLIFGSDSFQTFIYPSFNI